MEDSRQVLIELLTVALLCKGLHIAAISAFLWLKLTLQGCQDSVWSIKKSVGKMARLEGLEPPTYRFEVFR